jgi:imidazolonepropionase-like amidohydrolase
VGKRLAAWLLLSGCAGAPLLLPHRAENRATHFFNVRVFDGKSKALSEPTEVWVVGGRIASGPAPADALEVDGTGKVLLPGLFDAHVHFGSSGEPPWVAGRHLPDVEAEAAALLYCGVTTAVVAGREIDSHALANDVAARRISGPRLLSATRIITAPGGHPVVMYRTALGSVLSGLLLGGMVVQVHGEEEARAAVREELSHGAHHVKAVYHSMPAGAPHLTREELAAAIDEAKKLGAPTYVHVGTGALAVEAAQAGATLLMHTPWEDELSDAQARAIRDSGAAVVTTRRIVSALMSTLSGNAAFSALEKQVMRPGLEQTFTQKPERFVLKNFEAMEQNAAQTDALLGKNIVTLHRNAVTLIAGTDTGVPGIFHGAGLHEELKALVKLGLPAADVLQMATSNAARVVDRDGHRGVIEPGAIADLLLVEGDPLTAIDDIDRIAGVWQRGERQR